MKQLKSFLALVLMSMFASVAFAQAPKNNQSNKPAVLHVTRSAKQVIVTTPQDTTTYVRTRNADVSFATKQAFVNGTAVAFDNRNRDIEGNLLSRPFVEIGGGANYIPSGKEVRPVVDLTIGWETKNFILFANGFMSWKGYNESSALTDNGVVEGAEASGRYDMFGATLNVACKVWQDARYRSYLAISGGAGYGYCKTDGDNEAIRFTSSFYGLIYQAGVKGKWGISRHVGLTADIVFGNTARNYHDSEQDMKAFSWGLRVGLDYTF